MTAERPENEEVGLLRKTALTGVLLGAAGSLGFLFRAGQRSPQRLVMLLMAIWVISPFVALVFLDIIGKRWSAATRKAIYSMMFVVTVVSLAVYSYNAMRPRSAQPAALFVVVPPVLWALVAIAVAAAALVPRRTKGRNEENP